MDSSRANYETLETNAPREGTAEESMGRKACREPAESRQRASREPAWQCRPEQRAEPLGTEAPGTTGHNAGK